MKTILIIVLLTLSSCATPYAKHRDDPQFRVDYRDCEFESIGKFNPGNRMTQCLIDRGYTP